jgi:hypothetical protein
MTDAFFAEQGSRLSYGSHPTDAFFGEHGSRISYGSHP